jgi:hypothetical protein
MLSNDRFIFLIYFSIDHWPVYTPIRRWHGCLAHFAARPIWAGIWLREYVLRHAINRCGNDSPCVVLKHPPQTSLTALVYLLTRLCSFVGCVFTAEVDIEDYTSRFANEHHSYSFPRIMAVIGDGNTEYDVGKDGANQEAGACSVRCFCIRVSCGA